MIPGERVRLHGPAGEYAVEIADLGFGDGRGFRDDERRGPVHSVFFGDSFVWGFGVDVADAVSERLEALTGKEALNLGMTAFTSSTQYARLFERYAALLGAEHAFFGVFVGNDLEDNVSFEGWLQSSRRVSYPEWCTRVIKGVAGDGLAVSAQRFALRHSALWSTLTERLGGEPGRSCAPYDRKREVDLMRRAISRIGETARETGTRAILFVIPMKELVYGPEPGPETEETEQDTRYPVVMRLLRESGMEVVDLLPAFRKAAAAGESDLYFASDGHWTPAGHALAAAELKRHLDSLPATSPKTSD